MRVTAIDAFADLDQHPAVSAIAVGHDDEQPFSARALVRAANTFTSDAVMYLSPLENHPRGVTRLARGRTLWGNPPDVLRRVRDPHQVATALRESGVRVPLLVESGGAASEGCEWLQKPRASGGGRRVRPWTARTRVPRTAYLQERIDGSPCSIVFVAAEHRAVPLALSYQLVGEAAFGARGFQYCGSILPGSDDPVLGRTSPVVARAIRVAQALAARFGLVGLNGVDFIACGGDAVPIEVNPRWCASMELVDESSVPVFTWHMAACTTGTLPLPELHLAPRTDAVGKAVVFARADVTVRDTTAWLSDGSIRDVPRPHTRIRQGSPVCSVVASGSDVWSCRAALDSRARQIYAWLARW